MNRGNTLVQVSWRTHQRLKEAYEKQSEYPSLWTYTDNLVSSALSRIEGQLELSLPPGDPPRQSLLPTLLRQLEKENAPDKLRVIWKYIRPSKDSATL